jgi:hypothetical protein
MLKICGLEFRLCPHCPVAELALRFRFHFMLFLSLHGLFACAVTPSHSRRRHGKIFDKDWQP